MTTIGSRKAVQPYGFFVVSLKSRKRLFYGSLLPWTDGLFSQRYTAVPSAGARRSFPFIIKKGQTTPLSKRLLFSKGAAVGALLRIAQPSHACFDLLYTSACPHADVANLSTLLNPFLSEATPPRVAYLTCASRLARRDMRVPFFSLSMGCSFRLLLRSARRRLRPDLRFLVWREPTQRY